MSEEFFNESEIDEFKFDGLSIEDLNELNNSISPKLKKILLEKKKEKDFDLYDLFSLLKYIYIARNIREYGLLSADCYDSFKDAEYLLKTLLESNLIQISSTTRSFRNLEIIDLTEIGESLGAKFITFYIKQLDFEEILNKFGKFLLYYLYDHKITNLQTRFRYYSGPEISTHDIYTTYDNRLGILSEWSIYFFDKQVDLFSYLREKNICYIATNYAGTRGGEIRQPFYLIPPEFIKYLEKYKTELNYFNFKKEIKDFAEELLNDIQFLDFFTYYNEDNYQFRSYIPEIRNRIKNQIEEFKNKNATSLNDNYIENKDLYSPPFKISDEVRYKNIIKDLENEMMIKANKQVEIFINYELETREKKKSKPISKPLTEIIEKRPKGISIFMSYATKDAELFKIREIAEELTTFKEIEEVLYWQKDMHDNIIEYMSDNLGKCDVMILFCSPNALKSMPVKKEWTAVEAMNKPIIPIFIETEHIPSLLTSRRGLKFDFFNFPKKIQELYDIILKITRDIS